MKKYSNKRKDILKAASKIFGEKGLDNSSLDEIADVAGVAKGTIFYYFSSKDELFSSLLEEGVEVLSDRLSDIIDQKIPVLKKLEEIIQCHFLFFKENRGVCLMILSQLGNFQKRWSKSVTLIQKKYITRLDRLIIECKKDGLVDKAFSSEAIIVNLFSLLAVSGIDWAIFHAKVSEKEMINLTKRLVINGLKNNRI